MPAQIQTSQRQTLEEARRAARNGNAELAGLLVNRAHAIYPVTRRQLQTIQNALTPKCRKAKAKT